MAIINTIIIIQLYFTDDSEDEEPISDALVFSRHDFDAGQWI